MSRKLITAAVIAASALAGLPAVAEAHDGHGHRRGHKHHHHHSENRYRENCRTSGTTGLIVGGAAGALLGREIDGGRDRMTGTIVGAGTGALLGREISKKSRC
ncbi:glycine zipper 2TM domain-containing protein [Phenylobacterium sp. LjRoot219]|uniref:glycine zipper 2TM domain-containing protein n=1 Tax=Phenylobacterium sp. LjRoot219 TaxID=3342283 RepID=UPI003ECD5A1A